MPTLEEALQASVEYFNGNDLAASVFINKYALRDHAGNILESTPAEMHHRMAKEFARIEAKKYKKPLTEDIICKYFGHFKEVVPQGSPMYGIGQVDRVVSLSNCFLIEMFDSYGGICQADQELVQICKRRGGIGLDISVLRPNGSVTANSSHTSTGILPFMDRYSNSVREVGQANRRGASMISISVHHPEILEFCRVKRDKNRMTGSNLSIRVTDEFLNALEADGEYELRWPVESSNPSIKKKIKARTVWNEIVTSARDCAEPGVLFWDTIIINSPADSYASLGFETKGTNPCAELPQSYYDSCRLIATNLFYFVDNPFTTKAKFNFRRFYEVTKITQRLQDDLIDLELEQIDKIIAKIRSDPEPVEVKQTELNLWKKVKDKCTRGRRTGTGITALADVFAALGIPYGSRRSINITEKIYRVQKFAAYQSSIEMAEELGAFPIWNKELEKDNEFLKRFKDEKITLDEEVISGQSLWNKMQQVGRRNISILTNAPTGSVSILTQTSSGIEPLLQLSYIRRRKINHADKNFRVDHVDELGDKWQEYEVTHPKIQLWKEVSGETDLKKSPWHGSCAMDIDWLNRVKLQAAAQKHVDHSISSTINLPKNISHEKVSELYKAAWKSGCKGLTVYREGCRDGVLVSKKSRPEVIVITKTQSPKRPKSVPCDLFILPNKKTKILVVVGLLNDDPYEVFAMHTSDENIINHNKQRGVITKIKRGHYAVKTDKQEVLVKDTHKALTPEEAAITRLVSISLRHGADVSFIVHQLDKVEGDWNSVAKAIARVLKKYIADGTKVTGEECPQCKASNLAREAGCVSCKDCGWSKCS